MSISPTDRLFLAQSEAAKKESHDPGRQVGATLVSASGQMIATGTNRPPSAMGLSSADSRMAIAADPNWKYFVIEHAERNAICNAHDQGHSLAGATIYVTLFPCADCARAIVSAGVRRLVAPRPTISTVADEKWRAHFEYAQEIFARSGVEMTLFESLEAGDE